MAQTILHIDEIVSDPKVRGGRPVIKGTGLKVTDVMYTHTTGDCLSPEEIAKNFHLSVGQVYAALAYYYLHKDEIDEQLRREDEETMRLIDELEAKGILSRVPPISDEDDTVK